MRSQVCAHITIACSFLLGPALQCISALPDNDNWDDRFGLPCDNAVYALAVSGSSVYVGGYFTTIGGIPANRIAKWDGNNWSALGGGIEGIGVVYSLAISGSNLYAGGSFTLAGGQTVCNVAQWDGSNWSAVGTNAPPVVSMAVRGSEVIIGHISPSPTLGPYLARWDGTNWTSFGGGITAATLSESMRPVRSIVAHGSEIYIGGNFTQVGGTSATNIARWNGTQWTTLGTGLEYKVPYSTNTYTVASMLFSENDLYVCGSFTRVGGQNITNLAKWNGATWSPVGNNYWGLLNALAISSGEVFIGGTLDPYIDGGITKGVTKWNGTSWSPLCSGVSGTVYALATVGNDLYVGGKFTTAGGKPSPNFALWHEMPRLQYELLSLQAMRLSWPTQFSGLVLQSSTYLDPTGWSTYSQAPGIYNASYAVTNVFPKPAEFFRLLRPN